ncbi:hypothetical protein [Flavobacterium sp.]|uniref:hypothetical protein n=1 Tax=Flavobacterium sp. TaxID=239 RepID=UPI00391DDABF
MKKFEIQIQSIKVPFAKMTYSFHALSFKQAMQISETFIKNNFTVLRLEEI